VRVACPTQDDADALREIERVLLDPMATKPQLLDAMQLAKSIG